MTHLIRNAIRWNGELANQCTTPNQARDKARYLSNIRQLEQRLSNERGTADSADGYDSSNLVAR
jgi:hypothetical protein